MPRNHCAISPESAQKTIFCVLARLIANLSILFQLNSLNSPFSKTLLGIKDGRFDTFLALFSVG